MAYGHIYTLRHVATTSTAITFLQLKTGAASPALLLSYGVSQRGSVTLAQEDIAIVRKTAAATVTTAVAGTHLFKHRTGDPTADASLGTSATGVIGTVEGTDGDILDQPAFNVLGGHREVWIPDGRIHVPAGGIIALKFLNAPASQSFRGWMTFMELG